MSESQAKRNISGLIAIAEYHKLMSQLDGAFQTIDELTEENRRLKDFADWVINCAFDGCDADGCDIQEQAEHFGLLRPVTVTVPCCENCQCAEVGDFPMVCYKKTYLPS